MTKLSPKATEAEECRFIFIRTERQADAILLPEWGRWARLGRPMLGVKPQIYFRAKGTWEPNLRRYIREIPDDVAVSIDRAVASIPALEKMIVKKRYEDGKEWPVIRSELGGWSEWEMGQAHAAAVARIDQALRILHHLQASLADY